MPRGKNTLRSQRLSKALALETTPGWTAASEEMFSEPLQTPSPFRNRVLTRRTSVYVKNIHKARALIDCQDIAHQKSSAGEVENSHFRNTSEGKALEAQAGQYCFFIVGREPEPKRRRKQTISKMNSGANVAPTKPKKSASEKINSAQTKSTRITSSRSATSDVSRQKRSSASPVNVKQKSPKVEQTKETHKSKSKQSLSPKKSNSATKLSASGKVATKNAKISASESKATEETSAKNKLWSSKDLKSVEKGGKAKSLLKRKITSSPIKSPHIYLLRTPLRTPRSLKKLTPQGTKMIGGTPSSVGKKVSTPNVQTQTNRKQRSPSQVKIHDCLITPTAVKSTTTPISIAASIKKSKTETLSTPESISNFRTASMVVKSRSPLNGHRLGRKTVRIAESESRTPRTPIHRQATPGRLSGQSGGADSPALQSLSIKRKAAVTEVVSVTPIKAAKILGKVISSTSKKLPKKPKSATPQTSTPASGIAAKRPALAVPPVSEIRQSKRIKRGMASEEVLSVEDLSMTSLKTPEKKKVAVEAISEMEYSKAVVPASGKMDAFWGYCNIL